MTNYQFVRTLLLFFSLLLFVFLSIDLFQKVFKKQRMTEGLLFKNQLCISLFVVILNVFIIVKGYKIEYFTLYSYVFYLILQLLCFGLALFYRLRPFKERKNLARGIKIVKDRNKELGLQVEAILERFYFFTETEKDIFIFLELQKLFDQKKIPPKKLVKQVARLLQK